MSPSLIIWNPIYPPANNPISGNFLRAAPPTFLKIFPNIFLSKPLVPLVALVNFFTPLVPPFNIPPANLNPPFTNPGKRLANPPTKGPIIPLPTIPNKEVNPPNIPPKPENNPPTIDVNPPKTAPNIVFNIPDDLSSFLLSSLLDFSSCFLGPDLNTLPIFSFQEPSLTPLPSLSLNLSLVDSNSFSVSSLLFSILSLSLRIVASSFSSGVSSFSLFLFVKSVRVSITAVPLPSTVIIDFIKSLASLAPTWSLMLVNIFVVNSLASLVLSLLLSFRLSDTLLIVSNKS